jgi:hypothetical protein
LSLVSFLLGFFFGLIWFEELYAGASFAIFFLLVFRIFSKSNHIFVFREWALTLYCLNYLISPLVIYTLPDDQIVYGMKIPQDQYFNLALWGFIFFSLGMFIIPTKIFKLNYKNVTDLTLMNKEVLVKITIVTTILSFSTSFLPGELGFVAYLFTLIRYVGAFSLFAMDKKLWYYPITILLIELLSSFLAGMYHDAVMWIIFFALFYVYVKKPSSRFKFIGVSVFLVFILFIQAMKVVYRSEVWSGGKDASLMTVTQIGSEISNSEAIAGESNLLSTLNRGNQAWIFASTVDNMDRNHNFQGMTNVRKYFEAAILPRFLAPNKIKSGDREIFNAFSGHVINEGTSMGLGIFADGYVAYSAWGVYIFGFALGLLFSLTFKLVERWTKVSPFYVLLLLPLLNYAVRPDCELQTTINHLFKGILLYGFLVYLTRKRFTLDSQENQRKLHHLNLASSKK